MSKHDSVLRQLEVQLGPLGLSSLASKDLNILNVQRPRYHLSRYTYRRLATCGIGDITS